MKLYPFRKPLLTVVFVVILLSAFTTADIVYTVKIRGIEGRDVLKDGVKSSELTEVTVEVNQEDFKIIEFELLLARGKSPVAFPAVTVSGNKYSLQKYREVARPGDRLVIDVKKTAGSNGEQIHVRDIILQIPIK